MTIFFQFENRPLLFKDPVSLIAAHRVSSLEACFKEMELALKSGYYLAGFLSYEAGYVFEERLGQEGDFDFPLLSMGVYRKPARSWPQEPTPFPAASLSNLRLNILKRQYSSCVEEIRRHIALGDVYQITYCIKLLFDFCGSPWSLFRLLLEEQPVPYPAYLEGEDFHILSLSPEEFMKKKVGVIETKPMKGTWPRGRPIISDFLERRRFNRDEKNRAENVMIADLLRNDLGRLGFQIRAPRLFEVTPYKTLFQMTSTVKAKLPQGLPLYSLFAALFPSGSVTGAPKIRAMEIIRGLEKEPRRIYTGALGYITPRKDLFFNIPIRTLLIRQGRGEMGIGGGIVWDSTPEGEWREGLLKARFVTDLYGPAT